MKRKIKRKYEKNQRNEKKIKKNTPNIETESYSTNNIMKISLIAIEVIQKNR